MVKRIGVQPLQGLKRNWVVGDSMQNRIRIEMLSVTRYKITKRYCKHVVRLFESNTLLGSKDYSQRSAWEKRNHTS